MKKSWFSFFLMLLPWYTLCAERADSLLLYERTQDGGYRFYYDENYFLTDRDCSFLAIERDAGYNPKNRSFDGPFTDFDLSGRTVMTGYYENGKKEGLFQSFHSNGQLKWVVVYRDDMPTGEWKYYYPDGKPLYVVSYGENGFHISDYWDIKGKHQVKKGKGKFESTIKTHAFTEQGYEFIKRKGRIVDGKPHGTWDTRFVYQSGKSYYAGSETFKSGRIIERDYQYYDAWYSSIASHIFVPIEPFIRSELLIFKQCNIDEHSGFLLYLNDLLERHSGLLWNVIDAQHIEYHISVNKQGEATKITAIKPLSSQTNENIIQKALSSVPYWFPSYSGETYIDDTLKITVDITPDIQSRRIRFFNLNIRREKGF